jgi:HK97 family phage major capsid protein
MYSRMPTSMLDGAAFFINQSLWAKVLTSTAGGSAGAVPMFTPPGMLAQFPNGAIYGKPIVPVEYASAEGTVGDFVFANFADYLFVTKGGIKQATSLHAEFARDRQLMKFTWRVNGAPRTRVPLTPFKGSDTLSPYIALAARS